jgi:hypothetical protein
MKGDTIPDKDHIARYCGFRNLDEDGQIGASAFMLNVKKNEKELSVDWLEFLNCSNREAEITEMRNVYANRLDVGKKAKIAILNVGNTLQEVQANSQDNRKLNIIHDPLVPEGAQSPHSGIYGLKEDDDMIAELLAQCISESSPARTTI